MVFDLTGRKGKHMMSILIGPIHVRPYYDKVIQLRRRRRHWHTYTTLNSFRLTFCLFAIEVFICQTSRLVLFFIWI